jgi:hypothetical protein
MSSIHQAPEVYGILIGEPLAIGERLDAQSTRELWQCDLHIEFAPVEETHTQLDHRWRPIERVRQARYLIDKQLSVLLIRHEPPFVGRRKHVNDEIKFAIDIAMLPYESVGDTRCRVAVCAKSLGQARVSDDVRESTEVGVQGFPQRYVVGYTMGSDEQRHHVPAYDAVLNAERSRDLRDVGERNEATIGRTAGRVEADPGR